MRLEVYKRWAIAPQEQWSQLYTARQLIDMADKIIKAKANERAESDG